MSNREIVKSIRGMSVAYAGGKKFGEKSYYSIRLDDSDDFFRTGTIDPKVKKGDVVDFDVVSTDYGEFVDLKSLNVKEVETTPAAAKSSGWKGKATNSGRENYWNDKAEKDVERQNQISYQAATNTAVEICKLAEKMDALPPLGTKKADKFDNLNGIIEELAGQLWVRFHAKKSGPEDAAVEAMKDVLAASGGEVPADLFGDN